MACADGIKQAAHADKRFLGVTEEHVTGFPVDGFAFPKLKVLVDMLLQLGVSQVGKPGPDRKHPGDVGRPVGKGVDVLLLDRDLDGDAAASAWLGGQDGRLAHVGLVQEERIGGLGPVVAGLDDDAVGIGTPAFAAQSKAALVVVAGLLLVAAGAVSGEQLKQFFLGQARTLVTDDELRGQLGRERHLDGPVMTGQLVRFVRIGHVLPAQGQDGVGVKRTQSLEQLGVEAYAELFLLKLRRLHGLLS